MENQLGFLPRVLNILDEIVIVISSTYKILFANRKTLNFFKISEKSIKNNDFSFFCKLIHSENFIKNCKESSNQVLKVQSEFIDEKGNHKLIKWIVINISIKNQDIAGFVIIGYPHSKISEFKDKILALENELENVLTCTPGNLYWKDKNGFYLGANPSWLRLLNLQSVEQMRGKRDEELFGEDKADDLRSNDREVMRTGKEIVYEESTRFSNGDIRIFVAAKMPRYDEFGQVNGIIGNSLDITELKDTQEKLQYAIHAKTRLMMNAITEFRMPLNSLILLTDTLTSLKSINEHKELRECVSLISCETRALAEKINRIAKQIEYENSLDSEDESISEFKFKWILNNIVNNHIAELRKNNSDIYIKYSKSVPDIFMVKNQFRLREVYENVIHNAIRFTANGYIFINVYTNENELIVDVVDNGIGISKERQKGLFDFYSDEPSPNSGMKLSATKEFLDKIQGKISFSSEYKKGSSFQISINIDISKMNLNELDTGRQKKNDYSILIIDDDKLRAKLISDVFPKNCTTLLDPNELTDKYIKENSYDFIIIDENTSNGYLDSVIDKIPPDKIHILKILTYESSLNDINFHNNISNVSLIKKPLISDTLMEQIEKKITFLVVEDYKINQLAIKINLKQLGCYVDIAENLKEAKLLIDKNLPQYNCILLDISLPDGKGTDIIKYLKEKEVKLEDIPPIIVVTAFCSEEDQMDYAELGVDNILIKPIGKEKLEEIIQTYIVNKK